MKGWARLALPVGLMALVAAPGARAADPTIYVRYTMNCTFTISGDNGSAITAIPPGRYQVQITSPVPFKEPDLTNVTDPNFACGGALSFRLTGPGLNFYTSLEGGGDPSDEFEAVFQVGTYVAWEDSRPTVARLAFTVASGATSTGGGTTAGSGSSGASPSGNSNASIPTVGNPSRKPAPVVNLGAFRGTLDGSVSSAGKPVLKFKGKAVSVLRAGRYTVSVIDQAAKGGLTIEKVGSRAVRLTALPFVGSKTVTVTLAPGQWVFYSAANRKNYFVVRA